jgi:hypothetical protein
MQNNSEMFSRLQYLAKMITPEDIQEFEETIWTLSEQQNQIALDQLIQLFDEECNFREVMFSLVHAIESYPDEIYVRGILRNIRFLVQRPSWAKTLMYGILNNPSSLKIFKTDISGGDIVSLLLLLDMIYKESPHHRELIEELKKELGSQDPKPQ